MLGMSPELLGRVPLETQPKKDALPMESTHLRAKHRGYVLRLRWPFSISWTAALSLEVHAFLGSGGLSPRYP